MDVQKLQELKEFGSTELGLKGKELSDFVREQSAKCVEKEKLELENRKLELEKGEKVQERQERREARERELQERKEERELL